MTGIGHKALAGLAAVALIAGVSACSSSSKSTNSASSSAAPKAAANKSFVWLVGEDFSSLDSASIQSMGNAYADGVRNSTLLQYKLPAASPNPSSCTTLSSPPELEPTHLVQSWQTSADGKQI